MPAKQNSDERVLQIAQYIEDHADEVLNLDSLAEQAAISPFYLQRKFKALFGVSPKALQNAVRIQRLKQSLRQGDDISGAIYEAGFGSASRVYEQVNQKLGMTLSSYKEGGKNENIAFALRKTVFGHMIMAATDRGVCFVHFADNFADLLRALSVEFANAELSPTSADMADELDKWIEALEHHLAGNGPKPQVPLHLHGTAFQLSVWQFLMSVKEGQKVAYKDVAKGIEAPKSFRAVANACGANNIAVLIPCHRVLRGNGELGGYRWGVDRKAQLLAMEEGRES
ncbi:MAG: methylated-DNA--[protein]-cysteine S-methyltransferase [Algicola sp.]|nr:methylated-DNA--[protein]-cysteine S-methyltransferase [Algicola sp.]